MLLQDLIYNAYLFLTFLSFLYSISLRLLLFKERFNFVHVTQFENLKNYKFLLVPTRQKLRLLFHLSAVLPELFEQKIAKFFKTPKDLHQSNFNITKDLQQRPPKSQNIYIKALKILKTCSNSFFDFFEK